MEAYRSIHQSIYEQPWTYKLAEVSVLGIASYLSYRYCPSDAGFARKAVHLAPLAVTTWLLGLSVVSSSRVNGGGTILPTPSTESGESSWKRESTYNPPSTSTTPPDEGTLPRDSVYHPSPTSSVGFDGRGFRCKEICNTVLPKKEFLYWMHWYKEGWDYRGKMIGPYCNPEIKNFIKSVEEYILTEMDDVTYETSVRTDWLPDGDWGWKGLLSHLVHSRLQALSVNVEQATESVEKVFGECDGKSVVRVAAEVHYALAVDSSLREGLNHLLAAAVSNAYLSAHKYPPFYLDSSAHENMYREALEEGIDSLVECMKACLWEAKGRVEKGEIRTDSYKLDVLGGQQLPFEWDDTR